MLLIGWVGRSLAPRGPVVPQYRENGSRSYNWPTSLTSHLPQGGMAKPHLVEGSGYLAVTPSMEKEAYDDHRP